MDAISSPSARKCEIKETMNLSMGVKSRAAWLPLAVGVRLEATFTGRWISEPFAKGELV